jgi:glucose-6-phosphate isomerase
VSAGGLTVEVRGGALIEAAAQVREEARSAGLAAALAGKDATLWGPQATPEASIRLGWLDVVGPAARSSSRCWRCARSWPGRRRPRRALRHGWLVAGARGHLRLRRGAAGRGGHHRPGQVRSALVDLERTVVVVSSKSGGTVETDSHRRAARAAFEAAGHRPEPPHRRRHRPGSPFEKASKEEGTRAVFLADPDVGGRYSALTAFGLVPAGLAGADVAGLLEQAAALQPSLSDDDSPALLLGAVLGGGARGGRDKLVLPPADGLVGFGDWAEQLVAESTGKEGKGLLPVVVEALDAPGTEPAADNQLVVAGSSATSPPAVGTAVSGRSERSSWPGSTPPPSPAGPCGSTRSTSRTCRRARTTPGRSSRAPPPPSASRCSSRTASRCTRPATCSPRSPPSPVPSTRCSASCRSGATSR